MSLLNLLSITTNTQVSKTYSNPTDLSLKDSIQNHSKTSWNITETENFKLFSKKISFTKILPSSETFPTLKVKKPVLPLSSQVLNLRRKKNSNSWETNLKLCGMDTNTLLKLLKSIKNFKKSSKKLYSKSSILLINTIVNTNSNHSVKL